MKTIEQRGSARGKGPPRDTITRHCEGYGVCSDAAQQHFAKGKMLGGRSAVKKVCRTFLTSKSPAEIYLCRAFACQKSPTDFFDCASPAKHFAFGKMLLRCVAANSISLAVAGYCIARRAFPPRAPPLLYCFHLNYCFFTVSVGASCIQLAPTETVKKQ